MTLNGIPLVRSDLNAADGVAHIVADLIPNTDLGSDFDLNQSPIFDFLNEGGIKNARTNVNNVPNSLFNTGSPAFKSVGQINNVQTTNNGIPQISGLYETPVENNFNFNEVPSPAPAPAAQPNVVADAGQNFPASVSPAAPTLPFVPEGYPQIPVVSDSQEVQEDKLFPLDIGIPLPGLGIDTTSHNTNVSPANLIPTNDLPTIAETIAQFDETQEGTGFTGFAEVATAAPEAAIPTISNSGDVIASGNVGQSLLPQSPSPAPAPAVIPTLSTLYNAPELSSEERSDPFTSIIPSIALRSQTPASENVNFGANAARSFSSNRDSQNRINNVFISTPEIRQGEINPFDLSSRTKFDSFNQLNQRPSFPLTFNSNEDHDSFFVITRGNLNLQDVINKLDENIRRHIHVLDSPSIFFNNSVTELALQKSLPNALLNEIRTTLNANNMTFGNIAVTSRTETSQPPLANQLGSSNLQAILAQEEPLAKVSNTFRSPLTLSGGNPSLQSTNLPEDSAASVTARLPTTVQSSNTGKAIIHKVRQLSPLNEVETTDSHFDISAGIATTPAFAEDTTELPTTRLRQKLPTLTSQNEISSFDHQSQITNINSVSSTRVNSNTNAESSNRPRVTSRGRIATQFPSFETTTFSEFDVETTTLPAKTEKSLAPVSGLINLIGFRDDEKFFQEERFPIVTVSDEDIEISTESFFNGFFRTTTDISDFTTDDLIDRSTELPQEFIPDFNTEPPQAIIAPAFPPVGVPLPIFARNSASEDQRESLRTSSLSTSNLAQELQSDDVLSSSHEQEINVIDFLRRENLTAFADMLEFTGLNRDMIRGGELNYIFFYETVLCFSDGISSSLQLILTSSKKNLA